MRSTLLASSLLLVGFVGCDDAKKPETTTPPAATSPAPVETPAAKPGGMEGPAPADTKPADATAPAPAPAETKPATEPAKPE